MTGIDIKQDEVTLTRNLIQLDSFESFRYLIKLMMLVLMNVGIDATQMLSMCRHALHKCIEDKQFIE